MDGKEEELFLDLVFVGSFKMIDWKIAMKKTIYYLMLCFGTTLILAGALTIIDACRIASKENSSINSNKSVQKKIYNPVEKDADEPVEKIVVTSNKSIIVKLTISLKEENSSEYIMKQMEKMANMLALHADIDKINGVEVGKITNDGYEKIGEIVKNAH